MARDYHCSDVGWPQSTGLDFAHAKRLVALRLIYIQRLAGSLAKPANAMVAPPCSVFSLLSDC